MLLRSSSAPVLGSLTACLSTHAEAHKDLDPPFHSSPLPLPSPSSTRPSIDLHGSPQPPDHDPRLTADWSPGGRLQRAQSDGSLATMSKGSACLSAARSLMHAVPEVATDSQGHHHKQWLRRSSLPGGPHSALDVQESILEEGETDQDQFSADVNLSSLPEEVRARLQAQDGRSSAGKDVCINAEPAVGFRLHDGEVYTSIRTLPDGASVVCNSKGCRPLTPAECRMVGLAGTSNSTDVQNISRWRVEDKAPVPDVESHYQSLLRADPDNPLLLRNYAQYLCEVKGNVQKAEEYYERAILACPSDGEVLSQYAKLQWDARKDQDRAEDYFDQAVQAAPDDCYVLGSYASFLWESEENEDTEPSSLANPATFGTSRGPSPVVASA